MRLAERRSITSVIATVPIGILFSLRPRNPGQSRVAEARIAGDRSRMRPAQSCADFAWGLQGLAALLPDCDVVIIVDVLSFSTAVDVATTRGARILPLPYDHPDAAGYARKHGAVLAQPRMAGGEQLSLSPQTLKTATCGTRIVLPSPNGSMLSRETGRIPTLAGCLRNATAIAQASVSLGTSIGVVAAGERWPDGSLRPAIEDLLGAGSIIERMTGKLSPDAEAARAGYRALEDRLEDVIRESRSGRELIDAGYAGDVEIAVETNVSRATPLLQEDAYSNVSPTFPRA